MTTLHPRPRPARRPARRALLVVALLGVLAPASTGAASAAPDEGTTASSVSTSFPDARWLWGPIPSNPVLDARSSAMSSRLSTGEHVANLYAYGVPVYRADDSTRRYEVDCRKDWGPCGLEQAAVPIPTGARPSPGSDAAMVVVDRSTGKSFGFWQYAYNEGRPTASFGHVSSLSGDGRHGATGAGVSRLAGVIRTEEMRRGEIPHALVFSTDSACRGTYRYPATKSDGANLSGASVCIPEGARVQLDPAIDVDALPGLTAGERIVARALQRHGAYAIDNGGARMAFVFETPYGESDPYPGLGFEWDYYEMEGVPWEGLRVLRQWDGR